MASHSNAIIEPETSSPPLQAEDSIFPASFAQQRLWFLHRLDPESAAYNMALPVRLEGELDAAALQQALNEIIRRHEPLRTNFRMVQGMPTQVIAASGSLKMPVIDLSHFPEERREEEAIRLVREDAKKPFDLSRDLVVRAQLFRLSPTRHIFAPNIHHIASDGWSTAILFKELAVLYEDFRKGRASSLPDFSIQYADFAVWQREWLQGEVLKEQLDYWKTHLANAPALLEFPSDRPRPAIPTHRGARTTFSLGKSIADALRTLSHQEECSLFMTLLAAFQTLAMRCTGQKDIVIGAPIGVREGMEIEGLIGCFLNILVFRSDLSGDPTFRELLRRVQSVVLDAFDHQDVPLERLVEVLKIPRHPGRNPLFQILFQFLAGPDLRKEFGGLTMTRLWPVQNDTAKFDLTFTVEDRTDGLAGDIEYSADLFDRETIERLLAHYRILLEAIAQNPDQRISALPLLTESESQKLLFEWNDNALAYPKNLSITEYFEKQAEATPDAVAVVFGEQRVSYRQLNEQANQLAHHLQSVGVAPEVLVGVCLERSLEMVVGLLAVLKAGGAYVPLDPNYPPDRLAFMLEDAKVPVLLTQTLLLAGWPRLTSPDCSSLQKIILVDDWRASPENLGNPSRAVTQQNLAYVIYTSGSTGKPKGVAIEHRSIMAFIEWAKTVYSPADLNGVLFSTSICFDVSIFEFWVSLSLGGKVILAENALSLPSLPAANEVVLICTVPSAMAELCRMKAIPSSVRIANLAGELLSQMLVDEIYEKFSIEKIFDLYGPTEDTTYSTFTLRTKNGRSTIGRPIANTQAYVLDAHLQPVPLGVAGELYLGGAGLARGYLNRPDLTAEKFVSNPLHTGEPGARLYKTGDLVRYVNDGQLEFLGRLDHQVKIRGFRIEPGEIQALLCEHPSLREAVVMARDDGTGELRLIAYFVSSQNTVSIGELRAWLRTQLPDYMVPAAFVKLDILPLTPNGKVDRNALPAPEFKSDAPQFAAARTAVEQQVCDIWREILKIEQIGIHDNFFDLGGHSLLATQVISRMRSVCGTSVTLRDLFSSPTVAGLSGLIANCEVETTLPSIARLPRKANGAPPMAQR